MNKPASAINTAALYFTERLTRRLESIAASPLTLVEAPMGYGKTVAVREYLRRRRAEGVRTVWVPVPGAGEDAFWRNFCRAVGRSFPDAVSTVEALFRLGYPRDAVLADAACELLEQLDFGPQTILVADDIHLLPNGVSGGGMAGLCALLAGRRPEHLRLVLISRDAWPGDAGLREMLVLKGLLAVIDREVLALNAGEIRAYYRQCGLPLPPEEAAFLHKTTGGWISALYLYLLHYGKHGGLARPTAVTTLLEKEVFLPLSAATRAMLLRLAPVERFSAGQASYLYEGDAQEQLAELRARNAFISHDEAGGTGGTWALHSLLRQYLLEQLDTLPAPERQAIHRRCAEWFLRQKEAPAALDAFYEAGDMESALAVLESDISRNMVHEESRFFTELFRSVPDETLARHMGAAFHHAIAVFMAGDFAAFGARVGWIAAQCAAMPEQDAVADAWRGELEFLLSLAAYNDIAAMSAHHRRANALLRRPTRLFGPESPWSLGCPSVLFMFHSARGKLAEELALMRECMPHYYELAAGHGAGAEHLMQAEALYNAGSFADAAVVCHRAEAEAQAHGQLGNVFCALFLRMRASLFSGDLASARALPERMREMIGTRRDYFLLHTVDLCKGFLYAFSPTLNRVPGWLRVGPEEEKRLYTFAGGFYYLIHGRILLLDGQYARCAGLFAWLLESGVFARHLLFAVYAHMFRAAAFAALGKAEDSKTELDRALDMALPDNILMPFVENADVLLPLLRVASCEEHQDGVQRILALAEQWRHALDLPQGEQDAPFGLSEREYATAQLAVKGLTTQEMADQMGVSVNTIKAHLKGAYKKSGARNRPELRKRFGKGQITRNG